MSQSPVTNNTLTNQDGVEKISTPEGLFAKQEIRDLENRERPIYQYNGKSFAFRSRWEMPAYEGRTTAVLGAEESGPLPFRLDDAENRAEQRAFEEYVAVQDTPEAADVLLATNTPEGVLELALALSDNLDPSLVDLKDEIIHGVYSERALALIDQIAGALYVNDSGEWNDYIDTDAFALVATALAGNNEAQRIVEKRANVYQDKQVDRLAEAIENKRQYAQERLADVEALAPNEVSLVHATRYEPEYDSDGNVLLWPSGEKRIDKLPRASIHFTPNSQVVPHELGEWNNDMRLIVTSLEKMIEQNGSPANMSDVDTYYSQNPGEVLVLPEAVVIEPTAELAVTFDEGADGRLVRYKNVDNDHYTAEDNAVISELAAQYGRGIRDHIKESTAAYLRELLLRKVMASQGVEWFIESGPHYTTDTFQNAYSKLAAELGVPGALHQNTADSRLEDGAKLAREPINKHRMFVYPASIEAIRRTVANGYMAVSRHPGIDYGEDTDDIYL